MIMTDSDGHQTVVWYLMQTTLIPPTVTKVISYNYIIFNLPTTYCNIRYVHTILNIFANNFSNVKWKKKDQGICKESVTFGLCEKTDIGDLDPKNSTSSKEW